MLVNVHVDQHTFLAALARLAGVDPDAVTGLPDQLPDGALRGAVIARSRTCAAPDCDHHNRHKHRHPDLWQQLLDHDTTRRQGSGNPDDPRHPPPHDPPTHR